MADDFQFTELLPLGHDDTPFRLISSEGVSTFDTPEGTFLKVELDAIRRLTAEAMHDIAHFLRPGHLQQLRNILDDPEASDNDRFVALDLLKNAAISAGGILPMCQDTGTAIVKGKKGQFVFTGGGDERAIAQGVQDTYLTSNLRYSQMAPLNMYDEKNTGTNLPAEIKIAAIDGAEYKFLFMAKGGGSANKSYLFQETKALLNEATLLPWIFDKIQTLGTAACPPYHLGIAIGGTSAEFALETAKLASARYLDTLPTGGSPLGHGFRDVELEAQVLKLAQSTGIGAQFGGKYFCHDVRIVRLPRHGASCPVAIAVSCSADRQAVGKITAEGVFLEDLERDPARFLPETTHEDLDGSIAEIERTAELGLAGVMVPMYPGETNPYDAPSLDPLWAAAVDHNMPVSLHAATTRDRSKAWNKGTPTDAILSPVQVMRVLLDMIMGGVFERHPNLKVVSAEADVGWAGNMLERADYWFRRNQRIMEQRSEGAAALTRLPSEYFHDNVRVTFMRDRTGVLAREIIGVQTMMWGNDFPHHVSTWPESKQVIDEHFADQPDEVRQAIVCDNCRELYGF